MADAAVMEMLKYIDPKLLLLIPFLYAIGWVLKRNPKFKDEWMIPTYLMIIGAIVAPMLLYVMTPNLGEGIVLAKLILLGIIQGALCGFIAVGINETFFKQPKEKRVQDKQNKNK